MLLTNWGSPTLFNDETAQLMDTSSGNAYWIKVGAGCWPALAFMLLFFIAPFVFSDRDFVRA